MLKKVKRVLLKNGEATINLCGDVKSSIDVDSEVAKRIGLDLTFDPTAGVWARYLDRKTGELVEDLIPNGSFFSLRTMPEAEEKKTKRTAAN